MTRCGCNPIPEPFEFKIQDSVRLNNLNGYSTELFSQQNNLQELKDKIIYEYLKVIDNLECGIQPDLENILEEISLIYINDNEPIQYYRITFETVGGNLIESVRIKKNTSITLPVPTKSEHVFEGWYTNENYSGNSCPNVYIPTSDITLYAKWRRIPYTVTFSSNYESGESNSSYIPSGDSINIAEAPNRIGYTFVSWNTKADGTGISYNPGVPYTVTGNITFYAQWQINRYTVTFNPNYGSGITPTSIEVNYGTSLTNLNYPSLTRTGYTLLSWNINANGAGTNPSTVVNNITLYAQWQRNVPNTLTMYSFRTPQTDNYESASRTTLLTKNTETLIETGLKYHYIPVETEISVTKQEWGLNGIETITIGTCVYDRINDRYIYKIEDINLIGEEIKYN